MQRKLSTPDSSEGTRRRLQRALARPIAGAVRLLFRTLAFIARHPWSIGLSVVSAVCFIELAGEVREGELEGWDAAAAELVTGWRGKLDAPMLVLTRFGGGLGMAFIATIAFAVACLRRRRTEAVFIVVAAGGAGLLNAALKLGFHRARPDGTLRYLVDTPASFSFPSGHAMGAAGVLATVVVASFAGGLPRRYHIPVAVLATLLALGVALSRVYFGVHYPSDVLGGQLAAAAWVSAVTGVFYPRLLPGEEATEETHETVVHSTEQP